MSANRSSTEGAFRPPSVVGAVGAVGKRSCALLIVSGGHEGNPLDTARLYGGNPRRRQ